MKLRGCLRGRKVKASAEEKVGGGWRGPAEKKPGGRFPQKGGPPEAPHVGTLNSLSPGYKHLAKKRFHPTPFTMTDHILEVAETIQTASIVSHPSATHDLNPSTAASEKQPVVVAPASEAGSLSSDIVDPSRVIRPIRRRQTLPPLPDLRFEQSYLASLKGADTWGRVAWSTIRDQVRGTGEPISDEPHSGIRMANDDCFLLQVLLPLIQGTVWTLALSGWRFWNRNASLSGHTLGSRIRRWWYGVNNWKLPAVGWTKDPKLASQVEDVSHSFQ
jgi:hypothetical protein